MKKLTTTSKALLKNSLLILIICCSSNNIFGQDKKQSYSFYLGTGFLKSHPELIKNQQAHTKKYKGIPIVASFGFDFGKHKFLLGGAIQPKTEFYYSYNSTEVADGEYGEIISFLLYPSISSLLDATFLEHENVNYHTTVVMQSTDLTFEYQYHFLKQKKLDPFISVSPGLSLIKMDLYESKNTDGYYDDPRKRIKLKFRPLFAIMVGTDYFLNDHFSISIKGGLSNMMLQTGIRYTL